MLLRNKKTGEIKEVIVGGYPVTGKTKMWECSEIDTNEENGYKSLGTYNSLAKLNAEWEDVPEEPFSTSFYTIVDGEIKHCIFYRERIAGCPSDAMAYLKDDGREKIKQLKEVGLYFETEEEAEKAVEKLKAWKRLKDKGFHWLWYNSTPAGNSVDFYISDWDKEATRDITLLFGGEE